MKTIILLTACLLLGSVVEAQQSGKNMSIDITDFQGYQDGNYVKLSWIDQDAQSLKEVRIEKSVDGTFFECNGMLEVNKDSYGVKFSSTDHEPNSNVAYYRLKRYDKSGQSKFSEVIAVEYQKRSVEGLVFPNPVPAKEFFVNVEKDKSLSIQIVNNAGQVIYSMQTQPEKNEHEVRVAIPLIEGGLYRCIIEGNGNPKSVSLLVN